MYEPFFRHVIPPKTKKFGRVLLPSMCVEGQVSQRDDFRSESFGARFTANLSLARIKGKAETILGDDPESNSISSSMRFKTLGKKRTILAVAPLAITTIPIISLTLAWAVMLPKDIADLTEEGSKEIRNLMAQDASYATATLVQNETTAVRAQRDKVLQDLTELQVMAYGPVYERVFNRGINQVGDNYYEQVAELCPGIYIEGWLACLAELDIPGDNQAWAKTTPTAELPEPPEPYFPLIMPNFNEEEFLNQHAEEGGEKAQASDATMLEGAVVVEEVEEVVAEARELVVEAREVEAEVGEAAT
ncbi:hypothetical protein Acr_05g0009990 [Actinidia rufa]|uniref:Uncharacterized protein n=1 Tax=Actinidia rufa TaxID=165716 RepID=A0A7J0ELU0_9ERIC|nr:hypothetical protein Acr_05g0009990 [Actinidia rufa]